jgi:hypothetical protein
MKTVSRGNSIRRKARKEQKRNKGFIGSFQLLLYYFMLFIADAILFYLFL